MIENRRPGGPALRLNNGVEMPALGLGLYQSSPEETGRVVATALEIGYRLFDTAAAYGNEAQVGEGIRGSGIDRSDVFVITKLWISDFGYDRALRAFDGSMRRLGLEHVDLFLLHWPVPPDFDRAVESYLALERLLAEGRVRAIGVSNFGRAHLAALSARTHVVPAVNQIELHPHFIQRDLRLFHRSLGVVTQAWSPIGGVGRYASGGGPGRNPLEHPRVQALAQKHGRTAAQVVLRWHLEHGSSAVPKSVDAGRLRENFDVFDFALSPEEVAALDGCDTQRRSGLDPEHVSPRSLPLRIED